MINIAFIVLLGVVFIFLYRKDREDRLREENMYKNSLDQIEANTEKFYEMISKTQIKHFEQLEKHSSKLLKLLENKPVQVKEVVRELDSIDTNSISEAQEREDPFTEENRIPIVPGLKVQFEGEENVYPIDIN